MKKLIAVLFALASGLYLLSIGPAPDPVPFLDEGVAFLVLINCLAFLGLDLKRFFGLKSKKRNTAGQTIDIE
jgi:hypothetical protein